MIPICTCALMLAPPPSEPPRPLLVPTSNLETGRGLETATPALPEEHAWYLSLDAGLVTTEDSNGPDGDIEFDEGYALSVALGRRFGADDGDAFAFDMELEGLWTDSDANDGGPLVAVDDVSQAGLFLNGLLDVQVAEPLSVYGGAGIGGSFVDVGTESDSLNDFDAEGGPFLAWQAKAGVRLWTGRAVSWNVGYRFLDIANVEIQDTIGAANFEFETRQHILEVGLRFVL